MNNTCGANLNRTNAEWRTTIRARAQQMEKFHLWATKYRNNFVRETETFKDQYKCKHV